MLQAWLSKVSRRTFEEAGSSAAGNEGATFSPVLVQAITEFFNQERFVQVERDSSAASKPKCSLSYSIERVELISFFVYSEFPIKAC